MSFFGVTSSLLIFPFLTLLVSCQDSGHPSSGRSFYFPSSAHHSNPPEGSSYMSPYSAPYSDRRDGLLVSSALANSLFSPHAYADETPFGPMGAPPMMGPRSGPFSPLAAYGASSMAPFMGAPGGDPYLYGSPGGAGLNPSMFNMFSAPESSYNPYLAYSPLQSLMHSPLLSYMQRMGPLVGGLLGGPLSGMMGGPMGGMMGGPMGGMMGGPMGGPMMGGPMGGPLSGLLGGTMGPMSGSIGQGYGSPKIEIGQKLSNSIYANNIDDLGDNLRYDLSSFKDGYSPSSSSSSSSSSPSSSSYSSSSPRYPTSYSSQTNNHHHHQSQPSSSPTYSSPPSASYQSDYALASNGYRQYLNQQQNLLSNPTLYNRISQYMPYMAPAMSSSTSGNSRSTESLYSKAPDYYKSSLSTSPSSTSSIASSLSAAPGSSSSLDAFSSQKGSKAGGNNKEELGFFKRSDVSSESGTKASP